MSIIYNLIFLIFALGYFPYLLLTGRYHKDFKERFGIFPGELLKEVRGKDVIWLHAVSVGEVRAAENFCENLLKRYPSKRLLISTVTKTGNDVARSIFGNRASITYLPLDLSWVLNGVLNKISPKLFIIVETEIWPNLISSLARRNIPVAIINGRISPTSFNNYRKIRFFMKPILKKITLFCMQNPEYAERIKFLGAPQDKVIVAGNMKFDSATDMLKRKIDMDAVRGELGLSADDKVFVAGSTHPGEDEIILDVYKRLKKDFHNLKLILAPRHPERTAHIENLAETLNLIPIKISQVARHPLSSIHNKNSIFILDVMGRLAHFYSVATVVFMGGSLVPKGGQNILEPAVLGKPIIFGENMFNFKDITKLFLERKAACMIKDKDELLDVSKSMLSDFGIGSKLGINAKKAIEDNIGASRRNLERLENLL